MFVQGKEWKIQSSAKLNEKRTTKNGQSTDKGWKNGTRKRKKNKWRKSNSTCLVVFLSLGSFLCVCSKLFELCSMLPPHLMSKGQCQMRSKIRKYFPCLEWRSSTLRRKNEKVRFGHQEEYERNTQKVANKPSRRRPEMRREDTSHNDSYPIGEHQQAEQHWPHLRK